MTAPTAPAAATREAYPVALSELVEQGIDVVALDADLSASTMGYQFGEKYPERWHSVGIAEANMVGIGAGYAATGKTSSPVSPRSSPAGVSTRSGRPLPSRRAG